MTDTEAERTARNRYFAITGVNLAGAMGAVLGLLIAGRAQSTELTLLGDALILTSLYVMAVVPRALARRWKTPTL
jgi:hypothetical protein